MTRTIKILVLMGLLSALSIKGFSQLSITYYSSSLSKIGLAHNFNDRFWGEVRLYGNTWMEDVITELVVCYNINKKESHNVYIGLGGVVADYLTGFVIPIGVQFTPIEKLDRFSLHIDFQPTLDFDNDLLLQASWGLRYKFGKKE